MTKLAPGLQSQRTAAAIFFRPAESSDGLVLQDGVKGIGLRRHHGRNPVADRILVAG